MKSRVREFIELTIYPQVNTTDTFQVLTTLGNKNLYIASSNPDSLNPIVKSIAEKVGVTLNKHALLMDKMMPANPPSDKEDETKGKEKLKLDDDKDSTHDATDDTKVKLDNDKKNSESELIHLQETIYYLIIPNKVLQELLKKLNRGYGPVEINKVLETNKAIFNGDTSVLDFTTLKPYKVDLSQVEPELDVDAFANAYQADCEKKRFFGPNRFGGMYNLVMNHLNAKNQPSSGSNPKPPNPKKQLTIEKINQHASKNPNGRSDRISQQLRHESPPEEIPSKGLRK